MLKANFAVRYTDDNHKRHLVFVNTLADFNFIKDRFNDAYIEETF